MRNMAFVQQYGLTSRQRTKTAKSELLALGYTKKLGLYATSKQENQDRNHAGSLSVQRVDHIIDDVYRG